MASNSSEAQLKTKTPEPEKPLESNLAKVIEESKEKIAQASEAPPRKRGRPKKSAEPALPSSSVPSDIPAERSDTSLVPILRVTISLPFKASAIKHNFRKMELEPEVAEDLAIQADACCKKYFPQLSEKASIGVVFLFSLGAVSLQKWSMLQNELADRREKLLKEQENAPQTIHAPQHPDSLQNIANPFGASH